MTPTLTAVTASKVAAALDASATAGASALAEAEGAEGEVEVDEEDEEEDEQEVEVEEVHEEPTVEERERPPGWWVDGMDARMAEVGHHGSNWRTGQQMPTAPL